MNHFNISKRRNFVNFSELICEDLNYIFGFRLEQIDGQDFYVFHEDKCCLEFALAYLNLTYKIKSLDEDVYSEQNFKDDICGTLLNSQEVIDVISKYVDKEYTIGLDESSKRTKSVNEELQFTDEHARIVLKSSMMMRILIPVMAEFSCSKKSDFFFDIFSKVFDSFQPEGLNIINKLNKLIDSRILQTRYSDRVIWNQLINLSIDHIVFSSQLFRRIVVGVIPKIMHNKNVVSYLHVVIKKNIEFMFTKKFNISYKPINIQQNDEGPTDFDRYEINVLRLDEGLCLVNKMSVESEIIAQMEEHGIVVSEEEFNYYKNNIVLNRMQTNLLAMFFGKRLGNHQNIYNCDNNDYILACIIVYKWMKQNHMPILADYLIAKPVKYCERKTVSRQFLPKMLASRKYKALLNEKYRFVMPNLVSSGIIERTIATFKSNKFYRLPEFSPDIENIHEEEEIDVKIENICNEYLTFIEQV
jgi:hypothetical protein